jgi:hypothetical protein
VALEGIIMKWHYRSVIAGVVAYGAIGLAIAAEPLPPGAAAISNEASAAIQQMGKTLATDVSFKARTIRVYQDDSGDFLHIVHTVNVIARKPDRLAVNVTGDDGASKLLYDGKEVFAVDETDNQYAQVAMSGDLDHVMDEVSDRLHMDFPLADFLTSDPAKSFLTGVTSGKEVDTVKIDGTPCRHLFFTQSGGTELELWVENNDRALPRRLVVTYRALPGQPNFIAELSDWNIGSKAPDSAFQFQPAPGATKVDLARIQENGKTTGSTTTPGGKGQ